MKTVLSTLLLAFTLLPQSLSAQSDAPIRVTTTIRADGSRVDKKVDPSAGLMTETVYGDGEKVVQTINYKINANGDATEGTAFNADGKPIMKVAYKRDSANHVTEQSEYTPTDQLTRRVVYKYDGLGKLAGMETYDGKGNLIKKN